MSNKAESKAELEAQLRTLESVVRLADLPLSMRFDAWSAEVQIGRLMSEVGLHAPDFLFHVSPIGEVRGGGFIQSPGCRVTICHATTGARIECLFRERTG